MEFANLGSHCEFESCNQRDFLPFSCNACQKTFCLSHRSYKDHECTAEHTLNKTVSVCSRCHESVPVPDGASSKEAVRQHSSSCPKKKKATVNNCACDMPRCKTKDILNFDCWGCSGKFCMKHRSQVKHNCPGLERQRQQHRQVKMAARPGSARNLSHSRLVKAMA